MLLELFVILQVIALILFFMAFFTKQEILWAISAVVLSVLMISSFNLETYIYEFDVSLGAYVPLITRESHPYLMGLNLLFFGLAVILGLYDIFEKYGIKLFKKGS